MEYISFLLLYIVCLAPELEKTQPSVLLNLPLGTYYKHAVSREPRKKKGQKKEKIQIPFIYIRISGIFLVFSDVSLWFCIHFHHFFGQFIIEIEIPFLVVDLILVDFDGNFSWARRIYSILHSHPIVKKNYTLIPIELLN